MEVMKGDFMKLKFKEFRIVNKNSTTTCTKEKTQTRRLK